MSKTKTYLCKELTPAEWEKMSSGIQLALAWNTSNPNFVYELDNIFGFKDGSWCTVTRARFDHVGLPICPLKDNTLYDCYALNNKHDRLRFHDGKLVSDSYVGGDPEGMIFDIAAFSLIVEESPSSMETQESVVSDTGTETSCTSSSFALKYIPSAMEAKRIFRHCENLFEGAYTKVGEAIRSAMSNGERSVTVNIKGNSNFTDAVVGVVKKLGYTSEKTLAGDFDSDILISW